MEYCFDLFKERILTAIRSAGAPAGGGFVIATRENRERTERVVKHLALTDPVGEPLATLVETGRFGSIKQAYLLTKTHFYRPDKKAPLRLDEIRDVDWKYVENRNYPTVTAGRYRHLLLCSETSADPLHDVLEAIRRAFLLTRGAAAVFDAAISVHTGAPLVLTEEPPAFGAFSLEPDWLFAGSRALLVGGGDVCRGMEYLLLSADLGHGDAQYALGLFFRMNGVPGQDDAASAAYWFGQAAAQGHRAAGELLGVYTETTQEKGRTLWNPRRRHLELIRLAQGTGEEQLQAGALCLKRAERCLALALVLADKGLTPGEDPLERGLRAFGALKESRAWLESAQRLGHPEAETRLANLAAQCRGVVVNQLIPELLGLFRDDDALACRIWLAELGDGPSQIAVGRQALEETGLRRDPVRGAQWLERALARNAPLAAQTCAELGVAYATGAHLTPEGWQTPLPPSPRDRALGFYLLERSGDRETLLRHLPADFAILEETAVQLETLSLPHAAELAAKYRSLAGSAHN